MDSASYSIGCSKTKVFTDRTEVKDAFSFIDPVKKTIAHYQIKTFPITVNPCALGSVTNTCPYCGKNVTITVVRPGTAVSKEDSLFRTLKNRRTEQIGCGVAGACLLIGAVVAFRLHTVPVLWVVPAVLGLTGVIYSIYRSTRKVEVPNSPRILREEIRISQDHELIDGPSLLDDILR